MTPIAFDTRKAVRNLKVASFAEPQADAVVDTLADAFSDTAEVDVTGLETRMDARLARLETAMWKAGVALVGLGAAWAKLLDRMIRWPPLLTGPGPTGPATR